MPDPLLRAEAISRSVDGRNLWRDLSFELSSRQCLVLQGPSGSGKTLLLRTLIGLERLEEGRIECFGLDLQNADIPRLRSRIVLVAQSTGLTGRTVEDVLVAPFDFDVHAGRTWDRSKAVRLAARFDRDESFLSGVIDDLSGGERQITSLMRALLLNPDILLLDEPTAHLDPDTTRSVETLIGEWVDNGGAAIWTTHSSDQAERVRRGDSIDLSRV